MTDTKNPNQIDSQNTTLSLFPAADFGLRGNQSDLARITGFSRQTISRKVAEGIVTIGPDGKIDLQKAVKKIIENTDPKRLRARVFKPLVEDHEELRKTIQYLEERLNFEASWHKSYEKQAERVPALLLERWDILTEAPKDQLPNMLYQLMDEALFWDEDEDTVSNNEEAQL